MMRQSPFLRVHPHTGRALALGLCVAVLSTARGQWPCSYKVEVLNGPTCPDGMSGIGGKAMNEAGQPAGSWGCGFGPSFPWIGVGGPTGTVLGLPPGAFAAAALAINDTMTNTAANGEPFGQLAGIAFMPNDRSFLYDNEAYTILPMIENATASFVEGMNDKSIVIGYTGNYVTGDPPDYACYWSNGSIETVTEGRAYDVNNNGQITGVIGALITGIGFIWSERGLVVLPPITGGTTSQGVAINNLGHVAGVGALVPPGETNPYLRSFLWRDRKMTMLGVLPDYKALVAQDINDHDDIVGYSMHAPPGFDHFRPFLWRKGLLVDLNDFTPPKPPIRRAHTITNNGVIFGVTTLTALKLTPVYGPLGDLNCDGAVNVADLLLLLEHWGRSPTDDLQTARCDIDENGSIGIPDLLILLANWG